jgi:hypothetical protein
MRAAAVPELGRITDSSTTDPAMEASAPNTAETPLEAAEDVLGLLRALSAASCSRAAVAADE